jgi:hypothetical protein
VQPTSAPTAAPSISPAPTAMPSSTAPTNTFRPTGQPSRQPTSHPTGQPVSRPTGQPSVQPSSQPSAQPAAIPTSRPSKKPTPAPTAQPTMVPTEKPTVRPSVPPSRLPTVAPSLSASVGPTLQPSSGGSTSSPQNQTNDNDNDNISSAKSGSSKNSFPAYIIPVSCSVAGVALVALFIYYYRRAKSKKIDGGRMELFLTAQSKLEEGSKIGESLDPVFFPCIPALSDTDPAQQHVSSKSHDAAQRTFGKNVEQRKGSATTSLRRGSNRALESAKLTQPRVLEQSRESCGESSDFSSDCAKLEREGSNASLTRDSIRAAEGGAQFTRPRSRRPSRQSCAASDSSMYSDSGSDGTIEESMGEIVYKDAAPILSVAPALAYFDCAIDEEDWSLSSESNMSDSFGPNDEFSSFSSENDEKQSHW